MIKIQDIDPFSLPSVALSNRFMLPNDKGIYFVLTENEIVYIGKACSLVYRWKNHHKLDYLETIECVRIAWMNCQDIHPKDLNRIEQECILRFQPYLNGNGTIHPLHLRTTYQANQRKERYRQNTVIWADAQKGV